MFASRAWPNNWRRWQQRSRGECFSSNPGKSAELRECFESASRNPPGRHRMRSDAFSWPGCMILHPGRENPGKSILTRPGRVPGLEWKWDWGTLFYVRERVSFQLPGTEPGSSFPGWWKPAWFSTMRTIRSFEKTTLEMQKTSGFPSDFPGKTTHIRNFPDVAWLMVPIIIPKTSDLLVNW